MEIKKYGDSQGISIHFLSNEWTLLSYGNVYRLFPFCTGSKLESNTLAFVKRFEGI